MKVELTLINGEEIKFTTDDSINEIDYYIIKNETMSTLIAYLQSKEPDYLLSLIHISEPTRPY